MALRDLAELGLLLPREHWGRAPSASLRTGILTAGAALLGLVSALLVWLGAGNTWTFVGIGLFFLDLLAFLLVTFRAVEERLARLASIGAEGPTVERREEREAG
jgi:hypothetical protein